MTHRGLNRLADCLCVCVCMCNSLFFDLYTLTGSAAEREGICTSRVVEVLQQVAEGEVTQCKRMLTLYNLTWGHH